MKPDAMKPDPDDYKYGQWQEHWMGEIWVYRQQEGATGIFIKRKDGCDGWLVDLTDDKYHLEWTDLPGPTTLEEAQAVALALWRMR